MNKWNNQNYEYIIEQNIKYVYMIVERLNKENVDSRELIRAGIRGIIEASDEYDISKSGNFSSFCTKYIIKYVKNRKNVLIKNLKYQK